MAQTVVSRNTIQLAGTASAVNNYYNGYTIILTRYNSVTGKETSQSKAIIAYDGATKIATIDGIWDADFIPASTDTYKIIPTYPDNRVSINPAIQTLDYVTSDRYGKGLNPFKDLYLPSWLESGRSCDAQSDVTVKVEEGYTVPSVGAIYRYPQTGPILFQGEVKSWNGKFARFTKVIGKYTNKWNSWKFYPVGALVYDEDRLYRVTSAGTKPNRPLHVGSEQDGLVYEQHPALYKVSGTGDAVTALVKGVGNPVQSINESGNKISGYSLYDSDGVDYWRLVGWDGHDQRWVTRHQTNLIIDTSLSLFENVNSLLEHYGGILRYTAGQYHLEIEEGEGGIPSSDSEPRNIDNDNIIGKVRISDEGLRSSFNSLTVAYADPANKFEAKNISFFNSNFLKSDRNVPKKGNVSIAGITNYYNARILADKFLAKSRYGLTISLNLAPRGILLLAGKVIQVQNPRYGWTNKKFRIDNLTHNGDATVDIVASEYDDSFYVISNISRPPAAALAAESNIVTDIRPGQLRATSVESQDEAIGGIELNWANSSKTDNTVSTEIYGSTKAYLFITAASITEGSVFMTGTAHSLSVGDVVISQASLNGLEYGKSYFVKTTPSSTSFTLTENMSNPALTIFENGTQLNLRIMTGQVIATVDSAVTSYIDVIPGEGSTRVQKYYWIRHKITQS